MEVAVRNRVAVKQEISVSIKQEIPIPSPEQSLQQLSIRQWIKLQGLKLIFQINEDVFEQVRKAKGWKDKNAALARATGYTPGRISQIWGGQLSADLMVAIILACGFDVSRPEEWSRLFKLTFVKKNYQEDNYPKYQRLKPYNRISLFAEERESDAVFALAEKVRKVLDGAM